MFSLGMAGSYSVIAIPAFIGDDIKNNADEFLRVTTEEISWLGNLKFIRTNK